jgi:hypothetical protein
MIDELNARINELQDALTLMTVSRDYWEQRYRAAGGLLDVVVGREEHAWMRVGKLEAWIKQYGRHDVIRCASVNLAGNVTGAPCNCGFAEVLEAIGKKEVTAKT